MRLETPRPLRDLKIPAGLRFILHTLKKAGYAGYVVGGSLRNTLLKEEILDWDLVSGAPPDEIAGMFARVNRLGVGHNTVAVSRGKTSCEITSFRTGKARETGRDIQEDLAHRDFTINAMALDPLEGRFFDPFSGMTDLKNKRIRSVGDPEERFREDPLRTLRAVRLASQLHFKIHKTTLAAVRKFTGRLKTQAPERVRDELLKIMGSERPSEGIDLLRGTGLLKVILPELLEGFRLKQREKFHAYDVYRHSLLTADTLPRNPILRMAGLLHDIGKPRVRKEIRGEFRFIGHEKAGSEIADAILGRLRFSNRDRTRVVHLVRHHGLQYRRSWKDGAVRRLLARLGEDNLEDFFLIFRADKEASGKGGRRLCDLAHFQKRVRRIQGRKEPVSVRQLAVNGDTVISLLGIRQGKAVGKALNFLLEAVMEDPGQNTPEKLKAILMKRMADLGP